MIASPEKRAYPARGEMLALLVATKPHVLGGSFARHLHRWQHRASLPRLKGLPILRPHHLPVVANKQQPLAMNGNGRVSATHEWENRHRRPLKNLQIRAAFVADMESAIVLAPASCLLLTDAPPD